MPEGLSTTAANELLTTLVANYTYVKLHIGAPGAAATANPAVETTRKLVDWTVPAAAAVTNEVTALTWTNVAGTEDYTHVSIWTLATAGVFGVSGTVTANAVVAGDTFTIAVGDLDITMPVAS